MNRSNTVARNVAVPGPANRDAAIARVEAGFAMFPPDPVNRMPDRRGGRSQGRAPPDGVAAALLAAAGSVIGNTRRVSPWSGWREPPIVSSMPPGLPGSGKSPGIGALRDPLRSVERKIRAQAVEAPRARKATHDARTKARGEQPSVTRAGDGTVGETSAGPAADDPGPRPHGAHMRPE